MPKAPFYSTSHHISIGNTIKMMVFQRNRVLHKGTSGLENSTILFTLLIDCYSNIDLLKT